MNNTVGTVKNAIAQRAQVKTAPNPQAAVGALEQKLGAIEKENPAKATAESDDKDIHVLAFGLMMLVPMVKEIAERLVVVEHVLAKAMGHNPAPVQNVSQRPMGAPQVQPAPQVPQGPQVPPQMQK